MASRVKSVSIAYEQNAGGTLWARWTATKTKAFKEFKVVWRYKTRNGKEYIANDSTTQVMYSSYSPPDNAVSVKVTVTPKDKKASGSSKSASKNILKTTMPIPEFEANKIQDSETSNPIVKLEGRYEGDNTSSATHIEFQYVKAAFVSADPNDTIETVEFDVEDDGFTAVIVPDDPEDALDGIPDALLPYVKEVTAAKKKKKKKKKKVKATKKQTTAKLKVLTALSVKQASKLNKDTMESTGFTSTTQQFLRVEIPKTKHFIAYFKSLADGYDYQFSARAVKVNAKTGKVIEATAWSAWSDIVSGQFLAPTACSVAYKSKSDVQLTFEYPKSIRAQTIEVRLIEDHPGFDSENISAWPTDYIKGPFSSVNGNDFVVVNGLSPVKYWIQARVAADTDGHDVPSEWTLFSDQYVFLAQRHEAPSTWSSKQVVYEGEDLYLYWIANSKDGSREALAVVETDDEVYTVYNELPADEDISVHYLQLSTETAGTIHWTVQTAPYEEAELSDKSTVNEIKIYKQPTISVGVSGGDTISSFPIEINIESETSLNQKMLYYYIEVVAVDQYDQETFGDNTMTISAGERLWSDTIYVEENEEDTFTRHTFELYPSMIRLEDGMDYEVRVTASYDSGLTADGSAEFTFDIEQDEDLDFELSYDDYDEATSTIALYPRVLKRNRPVEGFSMFLYRTSLNGTVTLLNEEAMISTNDRRPEGIVDPHPNFGTSYYQLVAIDNQNGAYYYNPFEVDVSESRIVITWDEDWQVDEGEIGTNTVKRSSTSYGGKRLVLPYNISTSYQNAKDVALINYIGRESPVSYYGTQQGYNGSASSEVPKDDMDTIRLIEQLMRYDGDCYYRDPYGNGFWASVTINYNRSYNSMIIPINISWTKVEGGA